MKESTKKLGEIVKNIYVEDGNTQTPAIEIIAGARSLRDTLTIMKRFKTFFKVEEK